MKKILVLNGSFCEKPIIELAKEMGYFVITTGNMPELIGHKSANAYIPCDYSDKQAVLKLVKDNEIEGIISCANDFGVLTAAYVAEQMGWKGHDSYKNAELIHHKDKFKQYCLESGISSPHSDVFTSMQDALLYCKETDYPLIVKANDLTGGKGICRADNFEGAAQAIEMAFSISRDKHILIEPFIEGKQASIDVFIINKKIAVTSGCTAYSQKNPYLIQAETFPPVDFEQVVPQLHEIVYKMIDDLDLSDGILALQYIMKDGRPYIIEAMRRCFGNEALLLSDMITGFPWEEAYIKASLGLDCSEITVKEPQMKYCGHFGIMADCNGIVKNYQIDPSIEKHLFKKTEIIPIGGRIHQYRNERIAYLYYTYDSLEEMNAEVVHYNERIKVEMEPDEE